MYSKFNTSKKKELPALSFFEFESVFPVFTYVLQKKRLLYLWKVANNRFMVYFFAKILANILKEKYKDIPIVPVPPRPNKIKEKGWDQIDDLVSILEKKYKFSVIKLVFPVFLLLLLDSDDSVLSFVRIRVMRWLLR